MNEWHGIQQFEYRWQPSKDLSLIAGSAPASEIQPWRDRILLWVRHRANEAPTESVRYEIFADGMAALAWRQRTAKALEPGDGSEGRPEVSRVLVGPVELLTPGVAIAVCHTGLPEAIGPRPGKVAIGGLLPAMNPDELDGLARGQADELDRLALDQTGLYRLIAAAIGDCDTPLSVQLPQRVIERSPRKGSQGPLLWGLCRTVGPLLGHDSGARGWSFSTYELPQGDVDTGALADIVFRTQQAVQPGLNTRREILVRPHDPREPPATRHQDFAKLLIAAYQQLGGDEISQRLDAVHGEYGSVDKRIEGAQARLIAALPAPTSGPGRRRARATHPVSLEPQQASLPEGAAHTASEPALLSASMPVDAAPSQTGIPPTPVVAAADSEPAAASAGPATVTQRPAEQQPVHQPSRTPRPGSPRHAAPAAPGTPQYGDRRQDVLPPNAQPPDMPLPGTPQPGIPPAEMPLPGTQPSRPQGPPTPVLGAAHRSGADAPPLRLTEDQQQPTATGQRCTLVDVLKQLWTDPEDPEFESAVQLLHSGEFTSYREERIEARLLIVQHKWYLPVLEQYGGADSGDLLERIFGFAVIPDLGKDPALTEQLANWAEEQKAPPIVIGALNAAARHGTDAPRLMRQALERPLGRRWMTEHDIQPGPRTYTNALSGPRRPGAQAEDGPQPRWHFLEGRPPLDPVIILSICCAILIVLLFLIWKR